MVAPLLVVFMLATSVPRLNLEEMCRGAQTGALPEDRANAYKSCLRDETTARTQLQRIWNRISPEIRTSCSDEATGISPSYVDLLTCLEMRAGGNFSGAEPVQAPAAPPAGAKGSTPASPPSTPAPAGTTTSPAPEPGAGASPPAK